MKNDLSAIFDSKTFVSIPPNDAYKLGQGDFTICFAVKIPEWRADDYSQVLLTVGPEQFMNPYTKSVPIYGVPDGAPYIDISFTKDGILHFQIGPYEHNQRVLGISRVLTADDRWHHDGKGTYRRHLKSNTFQAVPALHRMNGYTQGEYDSWLKSQGF